MTGPPFQLSDAIFLAGPLPSLPSRLSKSLALALALPLLRDLLAIRCEEAVSLRSEETETLRSEESVTVRREQAAHSTATTTLPAGLSRATRMGSRWPTPPRGCSPRYGLRTRCTALCISATHTLVLYRAPLYVSQCRLYWSIVVPGSVVLVSAVYQLADTVLCAGAFRRTADQDQESGTHAWEGRHGTLCYVSTPFLGYLPTPSLCYLTTPSPGYLPTTSLGYLPTPSRLYTYDL